MASPAMAPSAGLCIRSGLMVRLFTVIPLEPLALCPTKVLRAEPIAGAANAAAILPLLATCHAMPIRCDHPGPGDPATYTPGNKTETDSNCISARLPSRMSLLSLSGTKVRAGIATELPTATGAVPCAKMVSPRNRLAGNRTGQHQREASSRRNGDDRRSRRFGYRCSRPPAERRHLWALILERQLA